MCPWWCGMRGREGGGFTSVIERVVRCLGRVGEVVVGVGRGVEFVFVGSRFGRVDILSWEVVVL